MEPAQHHIKLGLMHGHGRQQRVCRHESGIISLSISVASVAGSLFAGMANEGIYRSLDDGRTWVQLVE